MSGRSGQIIVAVIETSCKKEGTIFGLDVMPGCGREGRTVEGGGGQGKARGEAEEPPLSFQLRTGQFPLN
jgi:hypothetical protein